MLHQKVSGKAQAHNNPRTIGNPKEAFPVIAG